MMYRVLVVLCVGFGIVSSSALAQDQRALEPIKLVEGVTPIADVFEEATNQKPILIRTEEAAEKWFSGDDAEKLLESVTFDEQVLLLFAWRGSGQDELEYVVLESFPEQVVFSYKPGRTRDLRFHSRLYAVRSNVRWKTDEVSSDMLADDDEESGEYIKIEMKGRLNSQIFAIGGETTGVIVEASGATFELELGDDEMLRKLAEKLHEQMVIVRGTLSVRKGVEIRQRWIIDVESLSEPGDNQEEGDETANENSAYLQEDGSLVHALSLRDSQSGFAGESGYVITIEPDGSWRWQAFLNADLRDPTREGKLNQDELKGIAEILETKDLTGLPKRIGEQPMVNPHVMSLQFGRTEVAYVLAGGELLPYPNEGKDDTPERRFTAIVRCIEQNARINQD